MQLKFMYNSKISMQRRLLYTYQHRLYEYFLGTNFSKILQNITENVNAAFVIFPILLASLRKSSYHCF